MVILCINGFHGYYFPSRFPCMHDFPRQNIKLLVSSPALPLTANGSERTGDETIKLQTLINFNGHTSKRLFSNCGSKLLAVTFLNVTTSSVGLPEYVLIIYAYNYYYVN